jgi:hypothetical protein
MWQWWLWCGLQGMVSARLGTIHAMIWAQSLAPDIKFEILCPMVEFYGSRPVYLILPYFCKGNTMAL